jgi:hypothetical protein
MSNGRRKCVRIDGSAVSFRQVLIGTNDPKAHMLAMTRDQPCEERERSVGRTRRSKKLKRR